MVKIDIDSAVIGIEENGVVTSQKLVVAKDTRNSLISTSSDLETLKFPGYVSFNNIFMAELFKACSSEKPFYKAYKVSGTIYGGSEVNQMDIYSISNVKETQFIFNTFSKLSIKLNELRIGIDTSVNGVVKLHLHNKINIMLAKLAPDMRDQLAMFLYCLVKAFDAITLVAPHIVRTAEGELCLVENELEKMYVAYGKIPNKFTIECHTMRDDCLFGEVVYINNHLTGPARLPSGIKSSCDYVYNVITIEGNSVLVIVNKSYEPYEYYIISPKKHTILTNCMLQNYNTLDFNEWLPNMIVSLKETYPESLTYRLKFLTVEKLFAFVNTKEKVSIGCDATEYETFLDNYPNIAENFNIKLYEGVIKTKIETDSSAVSIEDQYKDDPKAQQYYKQVKPYYAEFDLKDLTGIVKGFANGDVYAMLFEGEPSTGKSTAARVIPSRCGIPFVPINCSNNIEESDLIGTMVPNDQKKNADDPEFVWKDGILAEAVRNGYTCILEEVNGARPGVLMMLNSLLDESRQLRLNNHEILYAHKNFRLIATCNIAHEGTNRMNKAFVDRFDICKKFVLPSREEIINIVTKRTGYTDTIKINKVLDVFYAIKKYSDEQHLDLVVSIRQLLFIFKQGKYFKNASEAVENVILNKTFVEEPEHKAFFLSSILKAMDLSFKL